MKRTRFARAGKPAEPLVHNRQATDLLRNARVAVDDVPDPYGQPGEKIRVFRSIRDDILAEMRSRGEIDQAQYDAGRKYERYAEQAEIGSVQAIDTSKPKVDGGRGYEGLTGAQIDAVRQLSEAARVLGPRGETIVRTILVDGKRFNYLGDTRAVVAKNRIKFFTYLEILAEHWGCATRTR
jgi:hypothetical protein